MFNCKLYKNHPTVKTICLSKKTNTQENIVFALWCGDSCPSSLLSQVNERNMFDYKISVWDNNLLILRLYYYKSEICLKKTTCSAQYYTVP